MFDHETRPIHFFVSLVMFVIGGLFALWPAMAWVGYLIVCLGIYVAYWLYKIGIEKEKTNRIRENYDLLVKLESLDAQTRAAMGLEPAKSNTMVVIDKSDLAGGFFAKAYREAPVAPWKLKLFAKGVKEGKPLKIREWTPIKEGKLFSDPEWRDLIAFMDQPDPENKHIKFVQKKHPTNERLGYGLTKAGDAWIEDVLTDKEVLVPTS